MEPNLIKLAELVNQRNEIGGKISALIGRPAIVGHIGEYIAGIIFDIRLEQSASRKAIDGYFSAGSPSGKSVNVKWYGKQESILDITPNSLPDYYLVMTGPRSSATSSRGDIRPWLIEYVYLFEIPGRVKAFRDENDRPDNYWIRQYSNPGNVLGQSEIGREILVQTGDKVDVFIASIGTGGSFLGISQVLKRELPAVKCIAAQPLGWEGWEDPLSPDKKFIPNISGGIVKEIRDSGIADEVVFITNSDAQDMAYRLSREEGIDCGISSGANVFVALNEAKKPEMQGKIIVTLIVDRGDRYLNNEQYTT